MFQERCYIYNFPMYIVQIVCIYSVYINNIFYKNQVRIDNTYCCNAVYYRTDVQPMCFSRKKKYMQDGKVPILVL